MYQFLLLALREDLNFFFFFLGWGGLFHHKEKVKCLTTSLLLPMIQLVPHSLQERDQAFHGILLSTSLHQSCQFQ